MPHHNSTHQECELSKARHLKYPTLTTPSITCFGVPDMPERTVLQLAKMRPSPLDSKEFELLTQVHQRRVNRSPFERVREG
jgi:hypothetical protein